LIRRRYRVSMHVLAQWIGVSRTAVYKSQYRFDQRGELHRLITEYVHAQWKVNKAMGGIKLHYCFVRDHPKTPIAERINQTFKYEYLCDSSQKTFEQIDQDLPQYIKHYNEQRPHMSCNHGFPSQVHDGLTDPVKYWKQRKPTYTHRKSR